jgi:medium-chain acyl-[acyl-carrier-protein] hydrolase
MQARRYSSSRWLPRVQARSKVKSRLICLPYAGSSAAVFNNWPTHLPATIDIYPIQLPGRCSRFNEPPFTQLAPLLAALAEAIAPYLDIPIAFFGHSMGALICFELAHTLRSAELRQPLHLFVSGHQARGLRLRKPCMPCLMLI